MPDVFSGLIKAEGDNSIESILDRINANFNVRLVDLKYSDPSFEPNEEQESLERTAPNVCGIVRTDNGDMLGHGSRGYGIYQFSEVAEIIRPALEEDKVKFVLGGCPNFGERMYLVMDAAGELQLGTGDTVVNRFILTSSHDGSSKVEVRMTPYRKMSQSAFITDARPLQFKHTKKVADRIAATRKTLASVQAEWAAFESNVRGMIALNLTDEEAINFITKVVGDSDSTRTINIRDSVFDLWKCSGIATALPYCKNTLFGLVQAFAEHADHHSTIRKSHQKDTVSANLESKLLAAAAKKKQKSYAMAMSLYKNKTLKGALR